MPLPHASQQFGFSRLAFSYLALSIPVAEARAQEGAVPLAERMLKATTVELSVRGASEPQFNRRPAFVGWARGSTASLPVPGRAEEPNALIALLLDCLNAEATIDRSWRSELPMLWITVGNANGDEFRLWTGVAGMPIYEGKELVGVGSPALDETFRAFYSGRSIGLTLRAPLDLDELRALPATIRELHLHNMEVTRKETAAIGAELRRFGQLETLSFERGGAYLPWELIAELPIKVLAAGDPHGPDWNALSRSTTIETLRVRGHLTAPNFRLGAGAPATQPNVPEGWDSLREFPNLRNVSVLGSWVCADTIEVLTMTRVERLELVRTNLDEKLLAAVSRLAALRTLRVDTGPSQAAGAFAVRINGRQPGELELVQLLLDGLPDIRQLRRIELAGSLRNATLADDLRAALPGCEIVQAP